VDYLLRVLVVFLSCLAVSVASPATELRIDFEQSVTGIGWKSETTQSGAIAADWEIRRDATAPSPRQVLTIHRINDRARNVFNLHWTPDIDFENGTLEVQVRANSGEIDQGGGLAWRIHDARNYYLARYNPLEKNLRVYVVTDWSRRQLASAENLTISNGRWWQLRISHTGSQITAWLDGVKHLQLTDTKLAGAGGVGLWAKADAASSFDDLLIKRFRAAPAVKQ